MGRKVKFEDPYHAEHRQRMKDSRERRKGKPSRLSNLVERRVYTRNIILAVVLTAILCVAGAGVYVKAQSTLSTFYIMSGAYPGAPDFYIYLDGSTYCAKSAFGQIVYQGTNLTAVCEDAYNALSSGNIVLKDLLLPSAINVTKDDVVIHEIYDGFEIDYPSPPHLPELMTYSLFYSGSFHCQNNTLRILANKGLWVYNTAAWTGNDVVRYGIQSANPAYMYADVQFDYYHTGNETDKSFAVGFFWGGRCSEAGAYFEQYTAGELWAVSGESGTAETTVISAYWDPNSWATLRIKWNATAILYYVDGVLAATHTTRVPNYRMGFGWEIAHNAHNGDFTYDSWMFFKNFRRLG